MTDMIDVFENVVRSVAQFSIAEKPSAPQSHPFDERNIHSEISSVSLDLFDNGHYSQATFEAFKYLDIIVKKLSGVNDSGYKLMMAAFSESSPKIKFNSLETQSEVDEQLGFKFIFAGAMSAIRNPRGHDINIDHIDRCLDHLSLASVLLRRLEERAS